MTGNTLKPYCEGERSFDVALCLGCTLAQVDVMLRFQYSGQIYGPNDFCVPKEVTRGQLKAVVEKYLQDHPEQLHMGASTLVEWSILGAFPCP